MNIDLLFGLITSVSPSASFRNARVPLILSSSIKNILFITFFLSLSIELSSPPCASFIDFPVIIRSPCFKKLKASAILSSSGICLESIDTALSISPIKSVYSFLSLTDYNLCPINSFEDFAYRNG